jgi:hypothetical protein
MTSFNSREDFLRALEENPQWKEAVRALILGEELLQLPLQFRAFVGQVSSFIDQTEAFISEQREVNTEQRQFNEGQRQFNEGLSRRLGRIEVDIGNFRGSYAESAAVRNAVAIAAELGLEYVRSVTQEELVRMSRSATGDIPVNQLRSFWTADLIIEARDGADTHYIAVESSYTADQRDTDRLQRNVQFLTEFTGQSARAVVVSVRNDAYVSALVESGAVYWFQLEDRRPVPE